MNLTNIVVAVIVGVVFYFVAVLLLAAVNFAIPTFVVALVAILVGIIVYKHGVTL